MSDTYVVLTTNGEALMGILAAGLFSGDILAVHKVSPTDVRFLRPDKKANGR